MIKWRIFNLRKFQRRAKRKENLEDLFTRIDKDLRLLMKLSVLSSDPIKYRMIKIAERMERNLRRLKNDLLGR